MVLLTRSFFASSFFVVVLRAERSIACICSWYFNASRTPSDHPLETRTHSPSVNVSFPDQGLRISTRNCATFTYSLDVRTRNTKPAGVYKVQTRRLIGSFEAPADVFGRAAAAAGVAREDEQLASRERRVFVYATLLREGRPTRALPRLGDPKADLAPASTQPDESAASVWQPAT